MMREACRKAAAPQKIGEILAEDDTEGHLSPTEDRAGGPVAERGGPVAERGGPVAERCGPVAERGGPVAERGPASD